jgi:guanine nucleotide-binding protein subunit gamma, fungi
MPASYEIRAGGDGKNKKQSMADLKLRRLNELNLRLKEDLDRPRVTVAQASKEFVPPAPPLRDRIVAALSSKRNY